MESNKPSSGTTNVIVAFRRVKAYFYKFEGHGKRTMQARLLHSHFGSMQPRLCPLHARQFSLSLPRSMGRVLYRNLEIGPTLLEYHFQPKQYSVLDLLSYRLHNSPPVRTLLQNCQLI